MFRMYKVIMELTETNEHNNYSVAASDFVNLLSVIITSRLFKLFDETHLLDNMTYSDVMGILRSAKKQRGEDGNWSTIRVTEKNAKVLETLGLAECPITVKNPVGRPKKSKT